MFMNSNLFEPGKSKLEKLFFQSAGKQNLRFDGRRSNECRDVKLTFGADWGTVAVFLSDTKVLAKVSCDIGPPTTSRPTEGKLQLNVSIGGVAFLDEVQSTHDERLLTLNSLLERTFRSSRCLDLESLCVAAEQHVWSIRVDINVLNHDGNLYDASTIATLAALMHFRRPDVTFAEDELRIYTEKERELIPLLFLHYPVSVTYCMYKNSQQPLLDPTLLEENAADSVIVLSFNSYQELCTLNAGGTVPTNVRTIMQCARNAAARCKDMVDFIRKALALDEECRRQPDKVQGFLGLMGKNTSKISFNQMMLGHQEQDSQMEVDSAPSIERQKLEKVPVKAEQPKKAQETEAAPMDTSSWLPQEASTSKAAKAQEAEKAQEYQSPPCTSKAAKAQETKKAQEAKKAQEYQSPPCTSKAEKAKIRARNKEIKKQQQRARKQTNSDSEEEATQIIF